ncbi:hypothetical protein J28TS4_01100 [Paenibacillus lautus]|nr:hypothetical protein J28TS4_01100 [Paenibacillus lautus]
MYRTLLRACRRHGMEIRLMHILIIIAEMPCLRASVYINCTIPSHKEVYIDELR